MTRMLEGVDIIDPGRFADGPPHELFSRMRAEAPVRWNKTADDWPPACRRPALHAHEGRFHGAVEAVGGAGPREARPLEATGAGRLLP